MSCEKEMTAAEFKVHTRWRLKCSDAECELDRIEAVAATLILVATNENFEDHVARSLSLWAELIEDECKKLRTRLYDG